MPCSLTKMSPIPNNKPLVVPASDAVHVQRIMEKAYASGEELKILKI